MEGFKEGSKENGGLLTSEKFYGGQVYVCRDRHQSPGVCFRVMGLSAELRWWYKCIHDKLTNYAVAEV